MQKKRKVNISKTSDYQDYDYMEHRFKSLVNDYGYNFGANSKQTEDLSSIYEKPKKFHNKNYLER